MGHPTINRLSDRPIYQQIADELRSRMNSGGLRPGEKLPSERELAEQHNTSRLTARRALQVLTAEGLAEPRRGVGVFVRPVGRIRRIESGPLPRRYRGIGTAALIAQEEPNEDNWRRELLYLGELPAPAAVASRFGINEGAPVVVRQRRLWVKDAPMQYAHSYFLPEVVAGTPLTQEDSGPDGGYSCLQDRGLRLTRLTEELRVRMPTPQEGQGLQLHPGTPVADLIRVAYSGEQPIEVLVTVMAGDRHLFIADQTLE